MYVDTTQGFGGFGGGFGPGAPLWTLPRGTVLAQDFVELYTGSKTYLHAGFNVAARLSVIHALPIRALIAKYGSLGINLVLRVNPGLTISEAVTFMDEGLQAFRWSLAHGEIRKVLDPAFPAEEHALICAEGYQFCFDVWGIVMVRPEPPTELKDRPLEAGDWIKLSQASLHWRA